MICAVCAGAVYLAEQKVYDGRTYHGLCFNVWKRQKDFEHNQEVRHAEYGKFADASATKTRIPNFNHVIYATQYDPKGTVPATAFASVNISQPWGNTMTQIRTSATAVRRQDSFSKRGTFPPRGHQHSSSTYTL